MPTPTHIKHVSWAFTAMMLVPLGMPVAQASNDSFLAATRALGFEEPDETLIRMALSACRFLQPHLRRHLSDVVEHISRHANLEDASIPPPGREPTPDGDANQFLVLAVHEYCPDLAYRLSE
jgi:hypothetical protein